MGSAGHVWSWADAYFASVGIVVSVPSGLARRPSTLSFPPGGVPMKEATEYKGSRMRLCVVCPSESIRYNFIAQNQ